MFWDVLLDATLDTLKVVPILYLVYLLVCYVGHNSNNKYVNIMNKTKKFGPLIGSCLGVIPQCGFSVVMSDLYSKKAITIGTLIAVMLATSDEALPLMISDPNFILPLLVMLGIKLVVAILFGYAFDLIHRLIKGKQQLEENAFIKEHDHDCELASCSHKHHVHEDHEHCVDNIFLDALLHTLQITAFLFVATFVIGLVVEYLGIENLAKIFTTNKFVQPFLSALVGLIPSCASSVFLVELYMAGGISFGTMMAGLCAGSGIGIVVLFTKNRKHIFTNIIILVSLYLIGSLVGVVCNLFV